MKSTLFKSQSILVIALMLGSGSAFAASEAPAMKKMDDTMSKEMNTMEGEMKTMEGDMKESTMDAAHKMEGEMDKDMSKGMQKMETKEKMKPKMGEPMKN